MNWFREHIKHGSRLALLALAIQMLLSFGHAHGVAQAAPSQGLTVTALPSAPANDHDQSPSADGCAICAVMALASTALFTSPPVLALPQAVELLYLTIEAEFIHLDSAGIAFQPRAPPAS